MIRRSLAYFHGMPGGPGEWAINAPRELHEAAWLSDRNNPSETASVIAVRLKAEFSDGVRMLGFSAGAFAAIQVAALMGEQVHELHLIAPAGPLQLGNFLPDMAGGATFRLAAEWPWLFDRLTPAARFLAHRAPEVLMRRLFATANGDDRPLAADRQFRTGMAEVFRDGLGRDARGFAAEMLAYVKDWEGQLSKISVPVTIWQGDMDNWTPPAMARALHRAMPTSRLEILPGKSHFSTLRAAIAQIG